MLKYEGTDINIYETDDGCNISNGDIISIFSPQDIIALTCVLIDIIKRKYPEEFYKVITFIE
jgi:hypothetical protein